MEQAAARQRAMFFIDGQNLYYAAKAFGYDHPNYDPLKLADAICRNMGWQRQGVRFYTGIHAAQVSPFWHGFWTNKLRAMGRAGVKVISRQLHYVTKTVVVGGQSRTVRVAIEKNIDVRLALDCLRLANRRAFEVAVIFSQDHDLRELVPDLRQMGIEIYSAFPAASQARGIPGMKPIRIDKPLYDSCLDPADYRPRTAQPTTAP
jgi:uncharacterized LabA/DUF88 family protein